MRAFDSVPTCGHDDEDVHVMHGGALTCRACLARLPAVPCAQRLRAAIAYEIAAGRDERRVN